MEAEAIYEGGDERSQLLKKVSRLVVTIKQATAELELVIKALSDTAEKNVKQVDEDGNPKWIFMVKVPIPKDIWLTPAFLRYANEKGYNLDQATVLFYGHGTVEGFQKYYQRTGAKWSHWTLVWQKWVRTDNGNKTKGSATKFDQQRTR